MVTLCPQGEEAQGPGLLSHTCHCFPEASPKIRGGPVAGTSSLPAGSWEESHREGKEREVKWKLRLVCTHPSFSEMGPFCGPPQATGPKKHEFIVLTKSCNKGLGAERWAGTKTCRILNFSAKPRAERRQAQSLGFMQDGIVGWSLTHPIL